LKVFAEAYIHREFESHSVRPSFVIIDSEQEIIIVGLTRVGGASLLFPRQFTLHPTCKPLSLFAKCEMILLSPLFAQSIAYTFSSPSATSAITCRQFFLVSKS
jgi:hypothetical protein